MSFYGLIRVKLSLSVLVIVLLFHNPSIAQQSNSPPCPMDLYARRHLCFGTLTFPDGAIYVGEFKDDKYDGQGTLTFPDGAKYVGAFKDDEYSGQGTYAFPDGAKYVGAYKDGLKNGQGTYTFPDGAKYVGAFKDGLKNGQGMSSPQFMYQ